MNVADVPPVFGTYGVAYLPARMFPGLKDIFAAMAEARINRRGKSGESINDRQDRDLATRDQPVMDKAHGPDLVAPCRFSPVLAKLGLDPALRRFMP